MLELEHITAGYGDTVVLRERDPVRSRLHGPGPPRAQRGRQDDAVASGFGRHQAHERADDPQRRGRHREAPVLHVSPGYVQPPRGTGDLPSLTVKDNLILQSPKGKESATIREGRDVLSGARHPLEADGGQSQRGATDAVLGADVASDPKIVVVDEASLGLAPIIVDRIFETLAHIASTGVSVLLVEQYVTRALALADLACLLNRGEVVFSGMADELEGDEIFERYFGIG